MMKAILRGSIFSLLLLGVASDRRLEWLQGSVRSQETALEVAVPDKATVVLKRGNPLTGRLTAFNQASLRLSAGGDSETVPLNQIKSIEFEGDVWIEGEPLPSRIRGYVKTWPGVPVTALRLQNPPQSAKVNLNRVLTPEELRKLLNIKDKVHVLYKINFNSPQKMTLEAFTMPKK
jgi:hypothetical protein